MEETILAEDVPPHGDKTHAEKMADKAADKAAGRRKIKGEERIVIKKYANRRLYNTGSSSYVTLEDLSELVKAGDDFVVYDAKTGEDITRPVLTQIIFEAENSTTGQNLLPIQFLRQLIRLYGDQMQSFVPSYLEMSLEGFSRQQERMREQMAGTFGGAPGFGLFDEQVKQNLALFDRAIKIFTPGYPSAAYPGRTPAPEAAAGPESKTDDLAELKSQIEAMRQQIEKLATSKG
jgi:polyhydroxyalkanoate synthesis repressor PhaR